MRFTKPSWVAHQDNHDPPKRVSIFSISVHPDGSRVATGGLDSKIRIWSTSPILSPKAEAKGQPKALCTLTMHNGAVLVVRWAASGKWLASGSDDTAVIIWDLDPNGGGRVWGTDDVNIEGWKALRRLTGHESDVVDCAWSPADRYLASVGLDSKVFIWCGYTLECLRRLDGHQGFVKGVCWDPVGEFLATQSDDKTVKIWRSTDWGLEATISKPFEASPGSTFYNRLSWSPDASYVATANAMNNNGAVFVSAILERDTWNSSISLVGHENTIQVASYNPRLFRKSNIGLNGADISINGIGEDGTPQRAQTNAFSPKKRSILNESPTKGSVGNPSPSKSTKEGGENEGESSDEEDTILAEQLFSVVALGADDRSISIWRTTDQRPLVVAKEAFDRQIMDIGWSFDGHHIWACSSDGSICVIDFEDKGTDDAEGFMQLSDPTVQAKRKSELQGMISVEEARAYIKSFDFPWPPPLEANQKPFSSEPSYGYQHGQYQPPPHQSSMGYGGGGQHYQSAYGGGYNQRPEQNYHQQSSHHPSPSKSAPMGPPPPPINQAQKVTVTKSGKKRIQPTFLGGGATVSSSSALGGPINMAPSGNLGGQGPPPHTSQSSYPPHGSHSQSYSHGHGPSQGGGGGMDWVPSGSRAPGSGEGSILPPPPNAHSTPHRHRSGSHSGTTVGRSSSMGMVSLPGLELPPLRTHVYAGASGDYIFEARNPEDHAAPTEVIYAHGRSILWLDYVPARAFAVARSAFFNAVSLDDSSIIVYSPGGRRLMPTLSLDSPAPILGAAGRYLMAITTTGSLYIWNVLSKTAHLAPMSLSTQITPATGAVTYTKVYDNGAPVITLANGTSITWDKDLSAWVRITESWWRQSSSSSSVSASPTRRHGRHSEPGHSPVAASSSHGGPGGEPPTAFDRALDLGHLETKLHASKLLGSPMDYRSTLLAYASRLADEGLAERANELVRDLCGPLFWDPATAEPVSSSKWEPKIVGFNKRELLQDILPIFARGRALSGMAQEWQILLARIESERDVQ